MATRRVISGIIVIGALAAAPVFAEDGQRRRSGSDRRGDRTEEQSGRAVGSAMPRQREAERQNDVQRQNDAQRQVDAQRQRETQRQVDAQRQREAQRQVDDQRQRDTQRQVDAQRQYNTQRQYDAQRQRETQRQYDAQRQRDAQRQYEAQRQYAVPRQYDSRRGYEARRDDRRLYYWNGGRYESRAYIAPRIIRPSIVTIVPYRPYVYRPSIGIGVYYGVGDTYPYGYTPRGYYDPIVGRPYGGVRITGAPRDAQVFADGYYVGIVNDFDGVFQHMNLEAGPHHIEIEVPGFEPVAFDVIVQPGRTITFRADMYRY